MNKKEVQILDDALRHLSASIGVEYDPSKVEVEALCQKLKAEGIKPKDFQDAMQRIHQKKYDSPNKVIRPNKAMRRKLRGK